MRAESYPDESMHCKNGNTYGVTSSPPTPRRPSTGSRCRSRDGGATAISCAFYLLALLYLAGAVSVARNGIGPDQPGLLFGFLLAWLRPAPLSARGASLLKVEAEDFTSRSSIMYCTAPNTGDSNRTLSLFTQPSNEMSANYVPRSGQRS